MYVLKRSSSYKVSYPLSRYVDLPEDQLERDLVEPIFLEAKKFFSLNDGLEDYYGSQMLSFGLFATAGLRSLPPEGARHVLDKVLNVFKRNNLRWNGANEYLSPSCKDMKCFAVKLLSGDEEGTNAWLAVNFLHGTLTSPNNRGHNIQTVAVLDMGGASTQICHEVESMEASYLKDHPIDSSDHISPVLFQGNRYLLFQHSFLGYGLTEAAKFANTTIPSIQDVCYPTSKINFAKCNLDLGKFFESHHIQPRASQLDFLDSFKIFGKIFAISAFSYVLDDFMPEGEFSLAEILKIAKKSCHFDSYSNPSLQFTGNYLSCWSTVFIYKLLKEGYRLADHKKVNVVSKISGHPADWALGVALSTLPVI